MRIIASCLVAGSLLGCHHTTTEPPIDLGVPRTLVYIADDIGAAKHGGGATGGSLIRVFEADTYAPVGEFDGGEGVGELHAAPDGSVVWIVATDEGTVSLFDTTTYESVELDVGVSPVHSFISANHDEVWVGNDGSSDISIISLATRAVAATVLTGSGHHKMAMVPGTGALGGAYVSNIVDGTITPVSAGHTPRANVVSTGPAPHGMDYSSVTERVYNCSGDANHSVEVIATTDEAGTPEDDRDTIVDRITLPARCSFLHVSEDGLFADATLPSSNQFARIRLSDNMVALFDTDAGPDKFAVVGSSVYVVNTLSATVSVVDLTGVLPTSSISVGNAVAPGATSGHRSVRYYNQRLFVPNPYDGTVSIIDTQTNTVVTTLTGMHEPVAITIAGPGFGTTYPR